MRLAEPRQLALASTSNGNQGTAATPDFGMGVGKAKAAASSIILAKGSLARSEAKVIRQPASAGVNILGS